MGDDGTCPQHNARPAQRDIQEAPKDYKIQILQIHCTVNIAEVTVWMHTYHYTVWNAHNQ